ncbi:MAG: ABC transporter substrate-binding protein [Solirubrobacterales bacterium]|nr:ABC transporter substrate-binding protein [Solirubrobacterales bacterium]HMT06193.1 ABC transporter substrate-binding protein [Solirubrobacterales bacterium]
MNDAATSPRPRISRIPRIVTVLLAAFMLLALASPQADAARNKRIVAISPFAAQTMIQLGVKPIRVGNTLGTTPRQKKLFRGIPSMQLSHPNGPNLEQLASLRPDIVFTSKQWEKGTGAMRSLGIRVINADPLSPNAVKPTVTAIGRILGRQKQARKLNARISAQLRSATRGVSGSKEKVLVVLGIGNTAMAFLQNSWGGRLVQMAGGRLVTGGASASGGFARLSDETVISEQPERIIVVPHGSIEDLGQVTDFILNNEAWKVTPAGEKKQIYPSIDNTLLQAGTDLGATVRMIRSKFLKNW